MAVREPLLRGVVLRIGESFGRDWVQPATSGYSKFTNEVQHLVRVLSWESIMDMSPLKSDVKLPVYKPRVDRSGKSLQVWIARHRQLLGS